MMKTLNLAIILAGALAVAWWSSRSPEPVAATAPASAYSAARAMADDQVMSKAPHPVGSTANFAVRDHLVARMTAIGLNPKIQHEVAFRKVGRAKTPVYEGATIENVIGVIPGADAAAPAVLLMAHYDSVPGSPGAADDLTGVSAGLEIMRALKAQGRPKRDVILLATDGEEAGMVGAAGFFQDHPLSPHVGFVINMESRGGGGKVQMFQTGHENGRVIDLFAKTASRPSSSSLSVFLYELLPNDTDFTASLAAGKPGLNYAFIGRQFDYHSATSTSAVLDARSLQHMGDQVLPVTRALAFGDALPGRAPNAVYAQTLGSAVLAYPPTFGWAVLALAAALLGIGMWRAGAAARGLDLLRGIGAGLYGAVAAAALFHFARRLSGVATGYFEQRRLLAQIDRWELALLLIGLGAVIYAATLAGRDKSRSSAAVLPLAAGLGGSLFGFDLLGLELGAGAAVLGLMAFGRATVPAANWAGVLILGLLAALGLQIAVPLVGFLVAWPLTIAAGCAALTGLGTAKSGLLRLFAWGLTILTLGWVLTFGHAVFIGLDVAEVLAVFAWLSALLLWPAATPSKPGTGLPKKALALLAVGLGLALFVRMVPPWSPRYPELTLVTYAQDGERGGAHRLSIAPDLAPWAQKVLAADGTKIGKLSIPILTDRAMDATPAPPIIAPAPGLTLSRSADGSLQLLAVPPPGAHTLDLDLSTDAKLSDASLNGRPVPMLDKPGELTRLRLKAVPQGVTIGFRATGPGALTVAYQAITPGWPADAKPLPPRDAKTMAFDLSDSRLVYGTRVMRW